MIVIGGLLYFRPCRTGTESVSMIELIEVEKTYTRPDGGTFQAVARTTLSIEDGEIYGIIGRSGAGKSTLVRLITLLERPTAGRVVIDGEDVTALDAAGLRRLRQRVGMIFQHFNLLSSKTVADNVAFPLKISGTRSRDEIRKRVLELLDRVGLREQADKYPNQLSGGQKQRVGIARALATDPKILLCDEATSALDPETTQSVLQLLAEINRELGLTIVLITHEMDVIRRICDKVAVLDRGQVVESGNAADVFLHPQHTTTRRFVQETEHVDENEQYADFAQVPGRIVRMTFRGESTYDPVLVQVARSTGMDFSILSGRIDRIKDTPYGQMILALSGGDQDAALRQIAEFGVIVEELRA